MMDLNEGLAVDVVSKASELIHFRVDVFLEITEESLVSSRLCAKSLTDLLCHIEISNSGTTSKLPEYDLLVRLSDYHSLFLLLLLKEPRVTL